jgi:hypothetical protein
MHYETVWQFETANFKIALEVTDCQDDPADSFEFPEDIEGIRNGSVAWFDARVSVYKNGHRVGVDHLGHCAYKTVEEFYQGHRDRDPMNRNSSIMRATRGDDVVFICHYFPSMVAEAIADARKTLGCTHA